MSDAPDAREPPLVPVRVYQPSFASGELAPALHRRSDLAKWRAGAAVMQNMVPLVQGVAARRSGTEFVGIGKDETGDQRLIPFQFSTDQQYVIEAGNTYFRFVFQGAYLQTSPGVPYEIATPYGAPDLFNLRFAQSADVLVVVHPNYPPMELARFGTLDWRLTAIPIGSQLTAPTGVAVNTAGVAPPGSPTPVKNSYSYAVTASTFGSNDEGPLSATVSCTNYDLGYYNEYGVFNSITWSPVTGADFYTIYRQYAGVFAKVGSTTGAGTDRFDDTDFTPDLGTQPPTATNPFAGGNYPGTVGYFQERRIFGGTASQPETIFASKSGNYTNFDVSNPVQDDDAITATLAARQVNQIRHLIPLTDLIIMTSGSGWRLNGSNGAITNSNFDLSPQTFVGSATVDPLVVGNRILFVEATGSSIREIAYQFVQNMYVSEDRSVYAKHLFLGHQIVSWAYANSPDKVAWAVRDDGVLLSLTYLQEQDIYAWAEHATQSGAFKSVAVITETRNGVTEDVAYVVVQRQLPTGVFSCIERMHTRQLGAANNDVTQAWHVDSALQYGGAPVSVVHGLDHLNGSTVAFLADGVPGTAVVTGGAIGLPVAASVIVAGLPMTSTLTTLPADGTSPGIDPWMGRLKHAFRARIGVENAAGIQGTVDGSAVGAFVDPSNPASAAMATTVLECRLGAGWVRDGRLTMTMATPLPATILSVRDGMGGGTMTARIVAAEPWHAAQVAERMRAADRAECWAWARLGPTEALAVSLAAPGPAWAGLLDEAPACLFGGVHRRRWASLDAGHGRRRRGAGHVRAALAHRAADAAGRVARPGQLVGCAACGRTPLAAVAGLHAGRGGADGRCRLAVPAVLDGTDAMTDDTTDGAMQTTISMTDDVFIKQIVLPTKGLIVGQHSHAFDHTSLLAAGSMRVWEAGVWTGDYHAPVPIVIRKNTLHRMQALTDGVVFYCIHNTLREGVVAELERHPATASPAPEAGADGVVIQEEAFDAFWHDARALIAEHVREIGPRDGVELDLNTDLARSLEQQHALQIVTARCNGRMFGYLVTIVSPSLENAGHSVATQTSFFVSRDFRGLGLRLQRASLALLRAKDVREVVMRTGVRGSGPRLGVLYRRLGARLLGESYSLVLGG